MQAALDHSVERIVYTSSVATLRAANGSVSVDETAPLADGEGIGSYKKSKVLAERLVERMSPSTPFRGSDGDRGSLRSDTSLCRA
jgi:dihydroflavonol-4-reductase